MQPRHAESFVLGWSCDYHVPAGGLWQMVHVELFYVNQPYEPGMFGDYDLMKEFFSLLPPTISLYDRIIWRHADTGKIHVSLPEAEYVFGFYHETPSQIGELLYREDAAWELSGSRLILAAPSLQTFSRDLSGASGVGVRVVRSPGLEKLRTETAEASLE